MSGYKKLLVVTDLDGSLLDETYSWQAAAPALEALTEAGIPLVLNSSKTMAEMQALALELENTAPIVAENGGILAVHQASGLLPLGSELRQQGDYWIDILGLSREFILEKAYAARERYGYRFTGYADWDAAKVSAYTGLSVAMSELSLSRIATEPIVWEDSAERRAEFEALLAKDGIRVLRGGRFLHLMGAADKADGSRSALKLYQDAAPENDWLLVALGDSANDQAMLEAADIAVVIPHVDGPRIHPTGSRVIYAEKPATEGWNEALLTLIKEHN